MMIQDRYDNKTFCCEYCGKEQNIYYSSYFNPDICIFCDTDYDYEDHESDQDEY